jgi:hypothetical protein
VEVKWVQGLVELVEDEQEVLAERMVTYAEVEWAGELV